MSAISPSPISTRITKPLKQVAQRQWTVLAAKGLIQTLVMSLALLLAIAVPLGYFEDMHTALRVALALIAWSAIVCTTIICLRPALHRWNMSRAAQAAEKSLPDSEERISSAVELSQAESQFRGSPDLVAHLMKQAEEDASRVNATAVIPFRAVFIWAAVFIPVIGLWMLLAYLAPAMFLRGLLYSVVPMRPAAQPSWMKSDVSLDTKEDQTVIEGDSLTIKTKITVNGRTEGSWANLLITYDGTNTTVSQPLTRNTDGIFQCELPNLQQSFKYKVSTDRGETNSPQVTVIARPKIAGITVKYKYPDYASRFRSPGPAEDANPDIHALAGTQVTLAVDTRLDPKTTLDLAASQVVVNEGRTDRSVPFAASADKIVSQTPIVLTAGVQQSYHIKLTATTKIDGKAKPADNRDIDPHTITIDVDQPPTITLFSKNEKVRPDEERVTVLYQATDDYGVEKVEAVIRVDDRPEFTMAVPINVKNRMRPMTAKTAEKNWIFYLVQAADQDTWGFYDQWVLSVPKILKANGVTQAKKIVYRLRATDTCVPLAHTADSEERQIDLDSAETQSFQEKFTELNKVKLEDAIKKAIAHLEVDGRQVAQVRAVAVKRAEAAEVGKGRAGKSRDIGGWAGYYADVTKSTGLHIARTGTDLSLTAGEFVNTPTFAELAKDAKAVADNDIKTAADDTTAFATAADPAGGEKAHSEIVIAHDKLVDLLKKVEEAANKAEAQELVKDAKKLQDEVAKAVAEHPEKVEENQKLQQQAINKLNEALAKDPSLKDQKAIEQAKALTELQNQVQQNQQKQTELQNQTAKQEEQQQTQKAANAVAEAQKELNKEVQKFAEAEKKPLEQAKAQTPDQKQQDQLVKNIENNQLQQAAQQAQAAADQLNQDAKKLDQQAQAAAKAPAAAEPTPQQKQDKQNEQNAVQAEKQADHAAQALKKDVAQKQQNNDAAQQAAQAIKKAAQQIEKQAEKIAQQNQEGAKNPDVQKAADAAKADAQQAAKDAQAAADAPNAQEAQQDANKAAGELAQAAKELNQAAKAQNKNQAAAAQAQKEADKADQTQKHAAAQQQKNADAAQQAAQDVGKAAEQIQQQADKIEQQNAQGAKDPGVQKAAEAAKADAKQAAKDAQAAANATDPQEAQKDAANAAKELAKAGQELNQAAQGEAKADQAQAQQQNQQAAADNQQAAAKAADQAKGLAQKQQDIAQTLQQQAQQQADAQQGAPTPQQAAQQQQALAQQTQQTQQAAQQLAQQAKAAQNPNLAQRADQAAKALEQAHKDQQQAAQAADAGKPAEAAQAQATAQQDLAKAAQALSGAPDPAQAQADAAPGQGDQGKPDAAPGQGEPGKPEAGQGQGKPEPGQGQGPPQQTQAQALAEAQQAQQQQNNPAAPAQAANALAQAAQQGPPGNEPGHEPGNEPGNEPGHEPGTTPHPATDPKMGISGSPTGGDNTVPKTVEALGFSPAEWAKLPPGTKHELMTAKPQSVPPAYKDQVKNYYLRRAAAEIGK